MQPTLTAAHRAYVARRVHCPQAADDVMQEIAISCWQAAADDAALVWSIVKRRVVDHVRRAVRRSVIVHVANFCSSNSVEGYRDIGFGNNAVFYDVDPDTDPQKSDQSARYDHAELLSLAGDYRAYAYLPQSVDQFPDADELRSIFGECGLLFPDYRLLNFGTIAIHWATKPPAGLHE